MNNQKSDVAEGLQKLASFAAFAGAGIPGVTFFTNNAPPLFMPVALLTSGFSVALLLYGYVRANDKARIPQIAVILMLCSIVLFVAYGLLLQHTTLTPPGETEPRIQLGFGMQKWSLTTEARELLERNEAEEAPPIVLNNPGKLLQAFRVWSGEPVSDVYKWWSIQLAGLLLIAVFLTSFSLWAYACGTLSKYFQMD